MVRSLTASKTEKHESVTDWPKKCGCGATFETESSLRWHPNTYREVFATTSSAIERILACSADVVAYKKSKGWKTGDATIYDVNSVEEFIESLNLKQARLALEWPRSCDCGASFNEAADLRKHPETYRRVHSSGTVHYVLACSADVMAYKQRTGIVVGTSILWEKRDIAFVERELDEARQQQRPSSNQLVIDLTTSSTKQRPSSCCKCEAQTTCENVLETPCTSDDDIVPGTPPNDITWPHGCDCDSKLYFPTLKSALEHLQVFTIDQNTRDQKSMCSAEMIAFKKKHGADPGCVYREENNPALRIADWPLELDSMKQCNCGATFRTIKDILNHPDMYIKQADGTSTLTCSTDIHAVKTGYAANAGYIIRNKEPIVPKVSAPPEESVVRCNRCTNSPAFQVPAELVQHMLKHETPLFECECHKFFANRREADSHVKMHASGFGLVCELRGCNKRFTTTANLKDHILSAHVSERNAAAQFNCKWPGCVRKFSSTSRTKRHMSMHITSMDFVCLCGQRMPTDRDVRRHLTDERHRIKRHNCIWPGCGKEFLSSVELRRHLMTHKKLEAPLQVDGDDSSVSSSIFNRFKF